MPNGWFSKGPVVLSPISFTKARHSQRCCQRRTLVAKSETLQPLLNTIPGNCALKAYFCLEYVRLIVPSQITCFFWLTTVEPWSGMGWVDGFELCGFAFNVFWAPSLPETTRCWTLDLSTLHSFLGVRYPRIEAAQFVSFLPVLVPPGVYHPFSLLFLWPLNTIARCFSVQYTYL